MPNRRWGGGRGKSPNKKFKRFEGVKSITQGMQDMGQGLMLGSAFGPMLAADALTGGRIIQGTPKKKKSSGGVVRYSKGKQVRANHRGCGKAIMPNRRKKTLYVGGK